MAPFRKLTFAGGKGGKGRAWWCWSQSASASERPWYLGVRWPRREPVRQLGRGLFGNRESSGRGGHLEDCSADFGERDIDTGERECLRIDDQIGKPQAHRRPILEDALEDRDHCLQVEQRLVYVEDDEGTHLGLAHERLAGRGLVFIWESQAR